MTATNSYNVLVSQIVDLDRDSAHDPRAIANYILELSQEKDRNVTMMQLIKLAYIADGWSLALLGKPLSKHNPQAWQFGPVYPAIYNAFKHFGARIIDKPARVPGTDVPFVEAFSDDEQRLLEMVVEGYGKLSAFALSNLTHQPDTPWSHAFAKGRFTIIPAEEMREHFNGLKAKRLVNAA